MLSTQIHDNIISYISSTLPELPDYNPQDGIQFPHMFPNMDAVKTFMDVVNLRGYSYRERNTAKTGSRISYNCKHCNNSVAFSRKGEIFTPTKSKYHICDCPREGRTGNKLQRFPPAMTLTALAALFKSGITNIRTVDDNTIINTLRDRWDFITADDKLAARIREEYAEIDPFYGSKYNNFVTDLVTSSNGDLQLLDFKKDSEGNFDRVFMSFLNNQKSNVYFMKYTMKKQKLEHYVAFSYCSEDSSSGIYEPFAWGSARMSDCVDNDEWFRGIVGSTQCSYVTPSFRGDVSIILSSGFNAFGLGYLLYNLCSSKFIPIENIINKHQALSAVQSPIVMNSQTCSPSSSTTVSTINSPLSSPNDDINIDNNNTFYLNITYFVYDNIVYYLPFNDKHNFTDGNSNDNEDVKTLIPTLLPAEGYLLPF